MKKQIKGLIAGALVFGMAMPALAEHDFGGVFKFEFAGTNAHNGVESDTNTDSYIASRFRPKFVEKINDNVTATWYGEVDALWGTGPGADIGADGINVETKNAKLAFKTGALTTTLGLQGVVDGLGGTTLDDDVAAAKFNFDAGSAAIELAYIKAEGEKTVSTGNRDIIMAKAAFPLSDAVKLGASVILDNDNNTSIEDDDRDVVTVGANLDAKFGAFDVDAILAVQAGEDSATVDQAAQLMFLKGATELGAFKVAASLAYLSGDDDAADDEDNTWDYISLTGGNTAACFSGESSYILYAYGGAYSAYGGGLALNNNEGLVGLNVNVKGMIADYSYGVGVTYAMGAEDNAAGDNVYGVELGANISRKVADAVTINARGGMLSVGDYYDAIDDADDLYVGVLEVVTVW